MKAVFEYIKNRINTDLPEFRTVSMFNDQLNKSNVERTEKAFRYPAVFIQLVTSEVRNRTLGLQDVVLQVICHLAYEGYKFGEKRQLADMDTTSRFDAYMHRLHANAEEAVQLTTFQRIIINESEDFDNVNEPILTYMTQWRCMGSYREPTPLSNWGYEITGTIP